MKLQTSKVEPRRERKSEQTNHSSNIETMT